MIILLHAYCWVGRWKTFENRSIFGEVMDKSIVCLIVGRTQLLSIVDDRSCLERSGTVWNGLPRHVTPRLCLLYLISPGAWKLISLGAISTDGPYCCNVRAVTPSHFDHFNRSCYVMLCPFLDSRGIWSNQLMPVKLHCHCLLMVTVQFHLQTYSVR